MTDDPIKVVCFELPGVLVQTVAGWEEALQRADIEVRPHRIQRLLMNPGVSEANIVVEVGRAPAEQFVRVLAYVSGYHEDEIRRAMAQWHQDLYPGLEDLLQDLVDHDIRLAVLANTNKLYWDQFENDERYAPIRKHVLHRFASFEIGDRKPSLDAYDPVDSAFGVGPESMLYFDTDSLNVEAARSLKWHTCQIEPDESPVAQMADKLRELGWLDHRVEGEASGEAEGASQADRGPAVQAEGAAQITPGRRGGEDPASIRPGSSNGDRLDPGLIDVHQLRRTAKACGWSPEQLAQQYLRKADSRLRDLEDALSRNAAQEVYQLAYAWLVSSASCGMIGMVELMREMRSAGSKRSFDKTDMLFTKVRMQHERIQQSLQKM